MQYRVNQDRPPAEKKTAICQVCGCDLGFGSQVPDGGSSEKDGVTEFACPKCGRNQVRGEECIQCGVIFEKILSTNQGGTDSAKTESWRKELFPWSVIALIVLCILLVVVTHFSTFQPDKKPENAIASNSNETEIKRPAPTAPNSNYGARPARPSPSVNANSADGTIWVSGTHELKVEACLEFTEKGTGAKNPIVAAQLCTCIDQFYRSKDTRFMTVIDVAANCLVLMKHADSF